MIPRKTHSAGRKRALAIRAGEPAPPFRLRDAAGALVSSDALRRQGPLVVVFHRGAGCADGEQELSRIRRAVPQLAALGASVVAISPRPAASGDGALIVLSDPLHGVAEQFGLRSRLPADGGGAPPVSALYVISSDGMVIYSEVHRTCDTRADPHDAITVLSAQRQRHPKRP